jgi:hypothetical protein
MNRCSLMIICSVLTITGLARAVSQTDPNHDQWLQQRYVEATSIKEGMTREDLLKVFSMDGGLQPLLPNRYVLRTSNLIKVDVEFDVPAGNKILPEDLRFGRLETDFQFVSNDKLKIKRISKPYVEPTFVD